MHRLAGSTLHPMNGIYERAENEGVAKNVGDGVGSTFFRNSRLVYRNELTKWTMALVDSPPAELADPPYSPVGGKNSEWIIIDDKGVDRFGHAGDTVIVSRNVVLWFSYRSRQT